MSSVTSPFRRVETRPTFPVLDTLRAVGALAVLTTHATFQSGDYVRHGALGTLFSRLDVGVAIFFVLSGFLLSRPYLARAANGDPQSSTRRYYRKRLMRIYPVYVVTVVLALTFIPENDGLAPLDWLRTLTLTDVYFVDRLPFGLTQMWSLAVEVAFYAVLPLLMLVALGRLNTLRPARVVTVLVALVVLSCWWHLGLGAALGPHATGVPMTWLPAFLTWFAVGIGLALGHVLYEQRPASSRPVRALERLGAMPGACWATAAAILLVCATPLAGPALLFVATPAESLTKHLLYAVVGGLLVLTGVFADRDGRYARLLSLHPLRHLGHISYSVFCIHLPVLSLVVALTGYDLFLGHGWQIWGLTLVVSLVASELLYRFVELPGMRLAVARRRVQPGADAASSSAPQQNTTR